MTTSLPTSPPNKKEFAHTFYLLGRISFWIQLLLGVVSGIALAIIAIGRQISDTDHYTFITVSIVLLIASLVTLGFRVYWDYRYTRLAQRLETPPETDPPMSEVVRVLSIGLLVSIIGALIAFVAADVTSITVYARSMAQAQSLPVYQDSVIRSIDILMILVGINVMGAHFLGGINSLGLLYWLDE